MSARRGSDLLPAPNRLEGNGKNTHYCYQCLLSQPQESSHALASDAPQNLTSASHRVSSTGSDDVAVAENSGVMTYTLSLQATPLARNPSRVCQRKRGV